MLDGKVGSEEEEGNEGGGGEECPLSPSGSFWVGCEGERDGVEGVLIAKEDIFGGGDRLTHGGDRLWEWRWKVERRGGNIALRGVHTRCLC